jgi:hypothetical protein
MFIVNPFRFAASTALANTDTFSTNTLANYTVTKDSGTPNWVVTGGAMNASSALGTQSICTYNSFSAANASAEVVINSASDSGVVVRFQDQNNFYLLALSDDSGSSPTANMRLYKRVAGTFTQLGSSYNATFPNLSSHTFRLTANGTTLTAYMDGVAVITVTDSAISAAGKVGMRANQNGGDYFDSFSWG